MTDVVEMDYATIRQQVRQALLIRIVAGDATTIEVLPAVLLDALKGEWHERP